MKSFYEFYRVIKAKNLFEQEMGDPMANANPPPPQGGPAAGGAPVAPALNIMGQPGQNAQAPAPAAGAENDKDMSNVAPSEGEFDITQVNQAIESLSGMIDNFKSMDEEKGTQVEELLGQLKSLVASLTGQEEPGENEGEEDQSPEDLGNGMSPVPPGGAGQEGEDGNTNLGSMGGMPGTPSAGTSQNGAAGMGGMGMAGGAAATGGPAMS